MIIGAAEHDAITSISIALHKQLSEFGNSSIHSWFNPDVSVGNYVTQLQQIPDGRTDDVLIYHLSYGIPELTDWLMNRPEQIVIWYHNVTPSHFYESIAPEFADGLKHGREEIRILKNKCTLAIADSNFNAEEMIDVGYSDVVVAKPALVAHRLENVGIDLQSLDMVYERFPNGYLLLVSQVLPHKRIDHAIEVLHVLREYHRLDIGLVIVGPIRQQAYFHALTMLTERLNQPNVLMMDSVSEEVLAGMYRSCLCFISLSQHEGLSVPPLEAMANRAPVIVRSAGAVAETVKSGGIVVPKESGVLEFAEVVAKVCSDKNLQSSLRRRGQQRVSDLSHENQFDKAVAAIVGIQS